MSVDTAKGRDAFFPFMATVQAAPQHDDRGHGRELTVLAKTLWNIHNDRTGFRHFADELAP